MDWGILTAVLALITSIVMTVVYVVKGTTTSDFNKESVAHIDSRLEKRDRSDLEAWQRQNTINERTAVSLEGVRTALQYMADRLGAIERHLDGK